MHYDNRHERLTHYREASWMRSFRSQMSTVSDHPVLAQSEQTKPKKSLIPLLLFAVSLSATVLTGAFGNANLEQTAISPSSTDFQLALFAGSENACRTPAEVPQEAMIARNPLYDGATELRPGGVTPRNPIVL